MTPKVTVTLGSSRPGGIDISLAGLAAQTFEDFEVVFVDARYHQRHRQVLEAVRRSGLKQPFFHVPNHRYRDDDLGTTSAGYNTGFMLAAGEIVVMLLDYAYAPPPWLFHHVAHQGKIVLGPHQYRTMSGFITRDGTPAIDFFLERPPNGLSDLKKILEQRENFDEISIFEKPFTADQLDSFPIQIADNDTKCNMPTGPLSWVYFNTKNESFPLQAVLDINGMDENCDRACIPGDHDIGLRLERYMSSIPWNVQEAVVHCLSPRRILPRSINIMTADQPLPPPYQDYWPIVPKGYAYFERVKTDSSIIRAPNPFDIRKRREEIWHWRELSQNEDAVIQKNIISDRNYYLTPL